MEEKETIYTLRARVGIHSYPWKIWKIYSQPVTSEPAVYTPTDDTKNADKEIFFKQLTTVMEFVGQRREMILIGWFQRTSSKGHK